MMTESRREMLRQNRSIRSAYRFGVLSSTVAGKFRISLRSGAWSTHGEHWPGAGDAPQLCAPVDSGAVNLLSKFGTVRIFEKR
jgi:hypothetical protein